MSTPTSSPVRRPGEPPVSSKAGSTDFQLPVLYLDLDDTVLSWADGEPRGVAATQSFVEWAMSRFEVRWLTKWCPSGMMPDDLLIDLSKMLEIEPARLRPIRGCNWEESGSKIDGIAWLEHTVLDRPFFWIENRDGLTDRDIEILESTGFRDRYLDCNVTEDEEALEHARCELERRLDAIGQPTAQTIRS